MPATVGLGNVRCSVNSPLNDPACQLTKAYVRWKDRELRLENKIDSAFKANNKELIEELGKELDDVRAVSRAIVEESERGAPTPL
jgi:hypothetical protein